MPTYDRPAHPRRIRSNRQTVQWVPVIETTHSHAVLTAHAVGIDLALWIDDAVQAHLVKTWAEIDEARYQEACDLAAERMDMTPTRHEFFGSKRKPFVRSAPEASGDNQAGRPSSRPHQNGTERRPGQRREAGAEPRAAAGAQRRGEHGEHPPVDQGEHRGTHRPLNSPRR